MNSIYKITFFGSFASCSSQTFYTDPLWRNVNFDHCKRDQQTLHGTLIHSTVLRALGCIKKDSL